MSTFRWWLTVGWVKSNGSVRSHTQASAFGMRRDEAEQPQARGVGEDLQGPGEPLGLVLGERLPQHGRAARLVDHLEQLHTDILTAVYIIVNVSTTIDMDRYGPSEGGVREMEPCCPGECC